ncbi:MAG: NAD(P)/FAD-dependent oxidoreductase [Acidimicrobiales bacterium]
MPAIIVVGASLAGVNAAHAIHRVDPDGELTVVGAELHRPYDRPPLSKAYLAGSADEDRLALRAAAADDALGATWRLGVPASGLALSDDAATVHLADGSSVTGDGVVVATGCRPRTLPGVDRDGVITLRTLDDARWLRERLHGESGSMVVVGFGFIGAEVAATARTAGWQVTIVEAETAPLSRVLDEGSGATIAEVHRQHGVDVRLGATVESVNGDAAVESVTLSDGTTVPCSVVVVGIGVIPDLDWLDGSGLEVDNGLVADATTLVAPRVVAAGDAARWHNPRYGRPMRVEQWDNAVEMGAHAGRRILSALAGADGQPYEPVPWFWSDQYDRKYQLAGMPSDRAEVIQGDLGASRFVVLYLGVDDRPVGVFCSNRPRQAIQGRQGLAAGSDRAAMVELLSE